MITKEVNSLQMAFTVSVPSSIEEYDRLAKQDGAALKSAVDNALYRGYFNDFRPAFTAAVEKETGIMQERNADNDVVEKEAPYMNRVVATLAKNENISDLNAVRARFAPLAQQTADSIVFDPSAKERTGSGSNLVAKTYLKIANEAFEGGKLAALSAKLASLGFPSTISDDKDASILSVAKAIAAREAKKREALTAEYAV